MDKEFIQKNDMNILLSIIVPVYNGAQYVTKTIQNILSQSFTDYELILIDDGSKDESLTIMRNFSEKDQRIKLFSKENEGICATRNFGINQANGKYIIFLDQDDDFDCNLCMDYVKTIINTKTDMCVFGRSYTITNINGSKRHYRIHPSVEQVLTEHRQIYEHIFNVNNNKTFLTIWNCIYKKELIKQHNILFSTELRLGYEDTLFNMFYASKCSSIFLSPHIHYFYQMRSGISTITKANNRVLDDFNFITNTTYKLINGLSHNYQNAYYFFILRLLQVPYSRIFAHKKVFSIKKKIKLLKNICLNKHVQDSAYCTLKYYDINTLYKSLLSVIRWSIRHKCFFFAVIVLDIIRFGKNRL